MHLLSPLVARLREVRHTGRWYKIAELSGVPYNTVARISQGRIGNPSVKTVEKLYAAMNELDASDPARQPG